MNKIEIIPVEYGKSVLSENQIFHNGDKEKTRYPTHQKRCVIFLKNHHRNIFCAYIDLPCFMVGLIGLG